MADQKTTFPELVGKTPDEAKTIISAANPDLKIELIEDGSPVTEDFCNGRIRVFTKDGAVAKAPTVG